MYMEYVCWPFSHSKLAALGIGKKTVRKLHILLYGFPQKTPLFPTGSLSLLDGGRWLLTWKVAYVKRKRRKKKDVCILKLCSIINNDLTIVLIRIRHFTIKQPQLVIKILVFFSQSHLTLNSIFLVCDSHCNIQESLLIFHCKWLVHEIKNW